jgi:hypothetical protein
MRAARGSSLLEVPIAFVIATLALGVLYRTVFEVTAPDVRFGWIPADRPGHHLHDDVEVSVSAISLIAACRPAQR